MGKEEAEKTIDKIKKLVAKANGTSNEHEAQTFMAKANELLVKHNLSEVDLEVGKEGIACSKFASTFNAPWENLLATCLADANTTKILFHMKDAGKSMDGMISILGDEINCEVTLHMYEVLRVKIRSLSEDKAEAYKDEILESHGNVFTWEDMVESGAVQQIPKWKDSYRKGFVIGLYNRFQMEKEARREEEERNNPDPFKHFPRLGVGGNAYDIMVQGTLARIEEKLKDEFGDVKESEKINVEVNHGSMRGKRDGEDYEHQKGLNNHPIQDESKLIE